MAYSEKSIESINETTHLLNEAAKLEGCRAIIQSQWENVNNLYEDKRIFRAGYTPYTKVFPNCRAFVHHGGAGTTQIATMSDCPSIVIAHIAEQFLGESKLKRLGVEAEVLSRHIVT